MQTDIIWISRSQSLNCIKVVRVLDPATGGDTFIANFSNDSLKYTDLEPDLGGMNKIKDIYGPNGPSQGNIVTFFAEFNTHYPEITGLENVTNKYEVPTPTQYFRAP